MLKKVIKYTDFNGVERSEEFRFNLNKAEIIEMDVKYKGGMLNTVQDLINEQDGKALHDFFRNFILDSVGKLSPDGRRFVKSQEIRDDFEQTLAYETLFMELITDAEKAAKFMEGVLPPVESTGGPVPPSVTNSI